MKSKIFGKGEILVAMYEMDIGRRVTGQHTELADMRWVIEVLHGHAGHENRAVITFKLFKTYGLADAAYEKLDSNVARRLIDSVQGMHNEFIETFHDADILGYNDENEESPGDLK